ncbi:MAG: precorrin-6y C5,15-methyltransferase (decarboxylating) subunit CbiE [Myxococcales bacterium]|nr:precorrin-6y C5,15-methyltransferase (decarboxylating) subunit CbiE [Myxococcales bacterium]
MTPREYTAPTALPAVRVVGIGDDGCASLTSKAMEAVLTASVLAGGERQLAFFPQFEGRRIAFKGGLKDTLEELRELSEDNNVCVLASGDPLFFGVGSLIVKTIGAEHVRVLPQPSSVQWAFARLGLKWDDAEVLSLHGRPLHGLAARLRTRAKVALLTDAGNSSARAIARHLLQYNQRGWRAHLCENLLGPGERVRSMSLEQLAGAGDIAPLHVLVLTREDADWRAPPTPAYLP